MNYYPPSNHPQRPDGGDDLVPYQDVLKVEHIPPRGDEQATSTSDPSIDLLGMLGMLWRRKLIILVVLVAGMLTSLFFAFRETPLYRASASLEVQARETQIIQGASIEPSSVSDSEFIGTQIALLKSRALAERVAESLNLLGEPGYANPNADRETRLRQAANAVRGGLSISEVRGARIINISFVSPQAGETARITNAVAENFIQLNLERRYNATSYAREFLEERLATTKEALEDTERRLVEYSKEQEILDLSSVGGSDIGSSLDASSLVALNASLTEAQNARILAEQRYREAVDSPGVLELVEDEALQALRRQRAELLSEYQQKLAIYKPGFPEMEALADRIELLENEIDRERTNHVEALRTAYRAAQSREDALAQRVAELKDKVLDLRGRSIDYNFLRREADTLRTQYDALLQRYKEISIVSGVGSSQVSILDRAQVPTFPFEPNISAALRRALMMSLVIAVVLAFLIEFLDDTIKTPDDITRKLGLRVLGAIPKFKSNKPIAEFLKNPKSPVSEAFSSTRASMQSIIRAHGIKSILVTAGKAAEGKSSSTLALASAFAAVGQRVLIIDGDLRRPTFTYDAEKSVGLSGVLIEGYDLHEQILPGAAENLFLLPAGKPPPNPAELLGSARIVQVINEAADAFDLVIVDSPPAQAYSDALSLSATCDATILVIQSGSVHRQTARRTIDRIRSANGELLGCLLTKFNNKTYGYGAGYGYNYGYGDQANSSQRIASMSASSRKRQIGYFKNDSQPPGNSFE